MATTYLLQPFSMHKNSMSYRTAAAADGGAVGALYDIIAIILL